MKAYVGYIVSGVAGALLVLAVQGLVNGTVSATAGSDGIVDVVRARKIVVVDGEGKDVVTLNSHYHPLEKNWYGSIGILYHEDPKLIITGGWNGAGISAVSMKTHQWVDIMP
jgi:hypothetical protein